MELPTKLPSDFWTAVGTISVIVIALGGAGIKWLVNRNKKRKITIEVGMKAHFPGYGMLSPGSHNTLNPPSPWTKPVPMLVAAVNNEDTIPVEISTAGIRLNRTGKVVELHPGQGADPQRSLQFPVPLPARGSFTINMDPVLVKRMLRVLKAKPRDKFKVWVAEPIRTKYFSKPHSASEFLKDGTPFEIEINHEPKGIVQQVGEEEYFPEGIFPLESLDPPPSDKPF